MDSGFWLIFAVRVPALLVALTVHEWAHAYTAMRKGDLTAYDAGRVSLNPFVHLDPIGSIGLLLGFFGWGRPVPVDHRLLRNPTRDSVWISFAGPLSNLTLAVIFGTIFRIWYLISPPIETAFYGDVQYITRVTFWSLTAYPAVNKTIWFLFTFLIMSIIYNLTLAFFNLIPLMPLDGSWVLRGFIPYNKLRAYEQIQQYGPMILIALIFLDYRAGMGIISGIIWGLAGPACWVVSGESFGSLRTLLGALFQSFR